MKTEKEIKEQIKDLEIVFKYTSSFDEEFIYLPKQIEILKWVLGDEKYG